MGWTIFIRIILLLNSYEKAPAGFLVGECNIQQVQKSVNRLLTGNDQLLGQVCVSGHLHANKINPRFKVPDIPYIIFTSGSRQTFQVNVYQGGFGKAVCEKSQYKERKWVFPSPYRYLIEFGLKRTWMAKLWKFNKALEGIFRKRE